MKPSNAKKKIVLGVVLISALAFAGLQSACAGPWGGGPDKWGGPRCGECDGSGNWGQQRLDDKSAQAHEAFLDETAEQRKAMVTKKAEMRAIMNNDNPDPKRIAELSGELFDLREQLHKTAREKGINEIGFGRGTGRGCAWGKSAYF